MIVYNMVADSGIKSIDKFQSFLYHIISDRVADSCVGCDQEGLLREPFFIQDVSYGRYYHARQALYDLRAADY